MNLTEPSFQNNLIYLFDVVGTIIFAVTGGVRGVRLKLDLLGVIVFSCTVGVGGGMIRDALIGFVPVASFRNGIYLLSCPSVVHRFPFAQVSGWGRRSVHIS